MYHLPRPALFSSLRLEFSIWVEGRLRSNVLFFRLIHSFFFFFPSFISSMFFSTVTGRGIGPVDLIALWDHVGLGFSSYAIRG